MCAAGSLPGTTSRTDTHVKPAPGDRLLRRARPVQRRCSPASGGVPGAARMRRALRPVSPDRWVGLQHLGEHAGAAPVFDPDVRRTLARNPATPVETLQRLLESGTTDIQYHVARNPSIPTWLLEEMTADAGALATIAGRADCPAEILERCAASSVLWQRRIAAANPSCPAAKLARLASDHWEVQLALAGNEMCPPEVLEQFSREKSRSLRARVAANPSTAPEVHQRLAADPHATVRAASLACPPAQLERLAIDGDKYVRSAAASNAGCTPSMLDALAGDPDWPVSAAVASNPSTPAATLERLALKGLIEVAHNPAASVEALSLLASNKVTDSDAHSTWVAANAARHAKT